MRVYVEKDEANGHYWIRTTEGPFKTMAEALRMAGRRYPNEQASTLDIVVTPPGEWEHK